MELGAGSVLLLAVASFLLLVVLYGFHPLKRYQLRSIPGPPPVWYAGNLTDILKLSQYTYYIDCARKYGKIFKVWYGAMPVVVVSDAELGRAVNLRNHNRHPALTPTMLLNAEEQRFDNDGILLTQNREFHRSLRNAWQPAFVSDSLEGYSALMNAAMDRLIRRLARAAAQEKEVDVWRYLGQMTTDVVGTASFGVEFRTQDEDADADVSQDAAQLVASAQAWFQINGAGGCAYQPLVVLCPPLTPLVRLIASVFPDAKLRELVAARRVLQSTCAKLLQRVRDDDEAQAKSAPGDKPLKRGVAPGSFLHHLARARHHHNVRGGDALSDTEIMQQAFTFLLGGYETTASALGFTIVLLSSNPDKVAKLAQELDNFGRARTPVNADLERLPYTQACFKEGLRIFPPGHVSLRKAGEDLNLAGMHVPKSTWLHVSICGIQKDPDLWGNPDEYVPERWIEGAPEEATDAQKKAWMPFGDGTRSCVGKRFAWEEALIALIRIYQRFEFKLSPGQTPLAVKTPFTLGPANGILVTPVLRHEE